MTDKFAHLEFLPGVLEEDQRFINEKDRSYGASWKKRGGVGVFMMLARKWDRLEEMMGNPRRSSTLHTPDKYDILEAIRLQGVDGADGTVLAEVRDLRRYLALVEAEVLRQAMGERSEIEVTFSDAGDPAHQRSYPITIGDFVSEIADEPAEGGARVFYKVWGTSTRGSSTNPKHYVKFGEGEDMKTLPVSEVMLAPDQWFPPDPEPGTPEDGGHHARFEDPTAAPQGNVLTRKPILLTYKEFQDLCDEHVDHGSRIGLPWRELYELGAGQDGRPLMFGDYREEYGR